MQLKIVTWNIWHGKYLNDVIDYLREADADIIGLQEVIEYDEDGKRINQAEVIAKMLSYKYIYCKAFTTDRHTPSYDQGNAIFSKYPIENASCHLLSTVADYKGSAETEPRSAVVADIIFDTRRLHIINTHLAYSHELRATLIKEKQLNHLLPLLQNEQTLLLGDFNSEPQSETIKKIESILQNTDTQTERKTWSVYHRNYNGFIVKGLAYRIDYIFTSEDINVVQTELGQTKASDHLPVLTIIEV